MAQSEAGMMMELGAEKKLSKKVSVGLDAELRTRNNLKTIDRWSIGLGAEYKPIKNVKLAAGYLLLNDNFRESISYKTDGSYNNWRPSYWGIRHRLYASVTGSYKLTKNLQVSLRERWQYTYRPAHTVSERWSYLDNAYDGKEKTYNGKGKNVLRSRLQVEYDKKGLAVTPYANVELFNAWSLQKVRYTAGLDWKLFKQHSVGAFYRYQNVRDDDDDNEPNTHLIGVGYKFKF